MRVLSINIGFMMLILASCSKTLFYTTTSYDSKYEMDTIFFSDYDIYEKREMFDYRRLLGRYEDSVCVGLNYLLVEKGNKSSIRRVLFLQSMKPYRNSLFGEKDQSNFDDFLALHPNSLNLTNLTLVHFGHLYSSNKIVLPAKKINTVWHVDIGEDESIQIKKVRYKKETMQLESLIPMEQRFLKMKKPRVLLSTQNDRGGKIEYHEVENRFCIEEEGKNIIFYVGPNQSFDVAVFKGAVRK